jgi:hypothetical protein
MSHKMLIFKDGNVVSSLADSCHILFACWKFVEHTQYITTAIMKSSIPSKNQFHAEIEFERGIDFVELMPGSVKV